MSCLSNFFSLLKRRVKIFFYFLNGRKPWSCGYSDYKFSIIECFLRSDFFDLTKKRVSTAFLDERVVEYPWLISRLPRGKGLLLDAGSCLNFECFIKNAKLKNKDICIFNLEPDARCFRRDRVSYFFGDLRFLPFKENVFDIITCISTLEHIGMNNHLLYTKKPKFFENKKDDFILVIKNFKLVLKQGGSCFLTIPFGNPVNLGWIRIFGSSDIQKIIKVFKPVHFTKTFYIYKNKTWSTCSEKAASKCIYFNLHAKDVWNESLPVAAESVCCLELKK